MTPEQFSRFVVGPWPNYINKVGVFCHGHFDEVGTLNMMKGDNFACAKFLHFVGRMLQIFSTCY